MSDPFYPPLFPPEISSLLGLSNFMADLRIAGVVEQMGDVRIACWGNERGPWLKIVSPGGDYLFQLDEYAILEGLGDEC